MRTMNFFFLTERREEKIKRKAIEKEKGEWREENKRGR